MHSFFPNTTPLNTAFNFVLLFLLLSLSWQLCISPPADIWGPTMWQPPILWPLLWTETKVICLLVELVTK